MGNLVRFCYIYGLIDPLSGNVRYIGKALDPKDRYRQHIKIKENPKTHKEKWIFSLYKLGLTPELVIIETTIETKANEAEQFWIAEYRAEGFQLTNGTDGGEGFFGYKPSKETIEKITAIHRGKKRSPEETIRLSKLRLGVPHTEDTRRKMSNSHLGLTHTISEDTKHKISVSNLGKKLSEETRERMSKSQTGRKHSLETKIKISGSQKKYSEERSLKMLGNQYAKRKI